MITVIGNCNVSMTVPVPGFPVSYETARYLPGQIQLQASGVALNVAQELVDLGAQVTLVAPVGQDGAATLLRGHCDRFGITLQPCASIQTTPRSVVLVSASGDRMVHTDLGDSIALELPRGLVEQLLVDNPSGIVLGNVPWGHTLIEEFKRARIPVLTDLQDLQGTSNPYDQPFLSADFLTASSERIRQLNLRELSLTLLAKSSARAVFLTLGSEGVLVADRKTSPVLVPAPPVFDVNTSGAGDMFAANLAHNLFENRGTALQAARAAVARVSDQLQSRRGNP